MEHHRKPFKADVAFVSCSDTITRLYYPVALALREAVETESVLIDTSAFARRYTEDRNEDNALFEQAGFPVLSMQLPESDEITAIRKYYCHELTRLIKAHDIRVVVVPHEYTWAYDTVQIAGKAGIASYHLRSGFLGGFQIGGTPVIQFVKRAREPIRYKAGHEPIINRSEGEIAIYLLKRIWEKAKYKIGIRNQAPSNPAQKEAPEIWEMPWPSRFFNGICTRIGVFGNYDKRRMIEYGLDPETIDVIGSVRTDLIVNSQPISYEELCQMYGFDPAIPNFIVWVDTAFRAFRGDFIEAYDEWKAFEETYHILQKLMGEINMLYMVHPFSDLEKHQRWLQEKNMAFARAGYAGLQHHSIYHHAKMLLGSHSTAMIEAMIFKKPIVKLGFLLMDNPVPQLDESGAAVLVQDRIDLEDQLYRLLNDCPFVERTLANQAYLVEDLLGPTDGKCSLRAAKSIVQTFKTIPDPTLVS